MGASVPYMCFFCFIYTHMPSWTCFQCYLGETNIFCIAGHRHLCGKYWLINRFGLFFGGERGLYLCYSATMVSSIIVYAFKLIILVGESIVISARGIHDILLLWYLHSVRSMFLTQLTLLFTVLWRKLYFFFVIVNVIYFNYCSDNG